ncbi:MAG: OmpA family protein [Mucilaginibacter sp.]
MKRQVVCGLILLMLATQAIAQEQLSLKQQADQLFERYEYLKSVNLYLKLADRAKPDVRVLERIADCFRNMNRFKDADAWYARAVTDTAASAVSHYNYAEGLLYEGRFDEAKQQYQIYFTRVHDPEGLLLKLSTCDSAAAWVKHLNGYSVSLSPNINSAFSEWGLIEDTKGRAIFTSDRKQDYGPVDNRTGNSWFKLYTVDAKGENIHQLFISNGLNGLTLDDYHIGPIALNTRGDTAYITLTTAVEKKEIVLDKTGSKRTQKLYTRRLQLVMAVKKHEQWVVIAEFPYNNINKYSVGHAALAKDGQVIYFTSDMPGGLGKTDIWFCEKQANGNWGKPINCGKTINTKEEEAFPEIGGDNRLYYSSKGLRGMGGYDIYAANGEKASWNQPINLKYPINSTGDDFCLVTRDGLTGYFSSNREGGAGDDDIYRFTLPAPSTKPAVIANTPNSSPPALNGKSKEVFLVNNIYYDLDKAFIRPDAALELDKLVAILIAHPTFKVKIASHTDSRASSDYNLGLSQRRSAAVVAYMVKKGIDNDRLITTAFGKTQLVNECADGVKCTEEQQQLNRRTEFRLVEQ